MAAYGQKLPTQLVSDLRNGDAVYIDLDGDGRVTEEYDQMFLGKTDRPDYTFSLNLYLEYKNFDLTMLWAGATHVARSLDGVYRHAFGQQHHSSLLQWVVDNIWTEENPDPQLPRLTFTNEKQYQAHSDIWDYDASLPATEEHGDRLHHTPSEVVPPAGKHAYLPEWLEPADLYSAESKRPGEYGRRIHAVYQISAYENL